MFFSQRKFLYIGCSRLMTQCSNTICRSVPSVDGGFLLRLCHSIWWNRYQLQIMNIVSLQPWENVWVVYLKGGCYKSMVSWLIATCVGFNFQVWACCRINSWGFVVYMYLGWENECLIVFQFLFVEYKKVRYLIVIKWICYMHVWVFRERSIFWKGWGCSGGCLFGYMWG